MILWVGGGFLGLFVLAKVLGWITKDRDEPMSEEWMSNYIYSEGKKNKDWWVR